MPEADKRSHHAILRSIADRVMLQRGLLPAFQALDLAELELIEHAVTRTDTPTRDLRKLCWCSIDHNDTQSLDQLTYAERLPQGEIKVLVAIADVEAMVKKHTALDAHARHNTCTVYTSVELYPMLPNKLANDLTSLSRDQERLAAKVELGDEPGRSDAEYGVQGHRDRRDAQCQADCIARIGRGEAFQRGGDTLGQRLDEDRDQRHQQEHGEEGEGGAQDQPLHQRRLAGGGTRFEAGLADGLGRAQAECGGAGHVSGPSRYVWRSMPAGR